MTGGKPYYRLTKRQLASEAELRIHCLTMNRPLAFGFAIFLWVGMLPGEVKAQFTYTTNNRAITITGYTGSGGEVKIPEKIHGRRVVSIGSAAFQGSSLTSIVIPASVTNIGDSAFAYCSQLTAVSFEGNAPGLGSFAFGWPGGLPPNGPFWNYPNCYFLPHKTGWNSNYGGCPAFLWWPPFFCTINDGTITIAGYLGSDRSVNIPNRINGMPVTAIGDHAFENSSLSKVTIPSSIASIGDGAFEGSALDSLTFLPNSVAAIGDNAFSDCGNLSTIKFPENGHIIIGNWSFLGCGRLTYINIRNSVERIGYCAFGNCTSLTRVDVSRSVTSVGEFAFYGNNNLEAILFKGNAPSADFTVFMESNQVTVYYLPDTQGWGPSFGGATTAPW